MSKNIYDFLNRLINSYIQLNPDAHHKLAELNGRCFSLQLLPFNIKIFGEFENNKLSISNASKEGEVTIIGTPIQFANISFKKNKDAKDLKILGDAILARDIMQLLDAAKIDWEEISATYLGDVTANYLNHFLTSTVDFIKSSERIFSQSFSEFIYEEKNWLPPKGKLSQLFNDIDDVRSATDRLEARINLFNDKRSKE